MNNGTWKSLEHKVKRAANEYGEVYVLTGPLYLKNMGRLTERAKEHIIPSAYWKVLTVFISDEIRSVGFIMGQDTPTATNACDKIIPLAEIEKLSRLDLFQETIKPIQDKSIVGC